MEQCKCNGDDKSCHQDYQYRDGVGVAMFQIVQMYDTDWPYDMRAAGQHEYADLLESFIADNDSITIVDVLHLRDFMAGCVMQRDQSAEITERLIYCSFCGASQYQSRFMLESAGASICDSCICECNKVLQEELVKRTINAV